ncbi:MAG: hypothetical protein M1812_007599 [Candelaria pacifica]|nr:MAG: hypothetical protein M1812_007599 [Candelaria pacifica]
MSMDAGGLAQMTYNNYASNGALGMPGSGFASRGKGSHIKRLSVAPPQIPSIDETQVNNNPTPRTSRSHLLAGLRTAPKSPTFPPSAPPFQQQHRFGMDGSKHADQDNGRPSRVIPQTATGSSFPAHNQNRQGMNGSRQMYSLPEQVLAPPAIQVGGDVGEEYMDPNVYADLVATNLYLAQQQQRLQQQLINVTAAAQQFQGLNLSHGAGMGQQQQQFIQPPAAGNMGFYNQQLQSGMQPVITALPDQPGVYSVYNPMTGQHGLFMDPNAQLAQYSNSPPSASQELSTSPPPSETPSFRAQVSPPPPSNPPMINNFRTTSPPKSNPSPPQEVNPLPPPSANAFRRGHKKALSVAALANASPNTPADAPKTGVPKSAGFPLTPMTGTFGPGQARAGEHPSRQPRGPPPLEELVAKPTSKHEGSKNFSTRQRRRAVHSLVRAGIERRGVTRTGSTGSAGSMTPMSESEITFPVHSDNDSDSVGSGSLSGKPSIGSLRAVANGAIGSERKASQERSRERGSVDSLFTANSVSSDEGAIVGGKLVEVRVDAPEIKAPSERRKTPMLVLTSAEKRKSSLF